MEVLDGRVAAPQAGRLVDVDHPVHVGESVALAAAVLTSPARVAGAAREKHLDGHAVAEPDAPPFGRRIADGLDPAHGLVAGDEAEARRDRPGEQLVVGAAEPARFDPQQSVVVADLGPRELSAHERARLLEDEGLDDVACRHGVPLRGPRPGRRPSARPTQPYGGITNNTKCLSC